MVESGYAESIIITLYLDKSAKKENTNGPGRAPRPQRPWPSSRSSKPEAGRHPGRHVLTPTRRTGEAPTRTVDQLGEHQGAGRPLTSRASIDKPRFNEPGRGARAKSGEHRRIGPEPTSWERFNESGEHRQTGRAPTSRNSRISQWCSYWTVALQRKSPNCEFIKSPYCHTASAQPCCPRAILPNFAFFGQFWRGKKAPPTFLLME
jgi:hypothetical protein